MNPLTAALAPAIVIIIFIRYCDRKNPEPWNMIFAAVFFGILAIPFDLLLVSINSSLMDIFGLGFLQEIPFVKGIVEAFVSAAIPEESAKLYFLWLFLRNNNEYDEIIDGIVYTVCIGMGFAGLENILYVFQDGSSWELTSILRAIFAVPAHYIFAVLMGFFYTLVHFFPQKHGNLRLLIWVAPVLAHGTYDAALMMTEGHIGLLLLAYLFITVLCIILHIYCLKFIAHIQKMDSEKENIKLFAKAVKEMDEEEI